MVTKEDWVRLSHKVYNGKEGIPLSSEQKKRAGDVRILHAAMYHISDKKLCDALTFGTIVGTSLTARDVKNAQRLFGPCLACKAGKTKRPGYTSSENEPAEKVGDVVHADIYALDKETIGGYNYMLLSVDEYSGYLDIVPIKNKGQKHLVKAFATLEAAYKRQQYTINTIQTDHEANLWSCNDALGLRGIKLTQVPPYQHAQRVERHVQEINTKQRCVLAGIQYELPKYLHGELLKAVVYNQNNKPQASHPTTTPRALFEGKRLDLTSMR